VARAIAQSQPTRPDQKKKFAKQLWHSQPIEPKHHRPKVIGDKYPGLANDWHQRFFPDFAEFAEIVNYDLAAEYNQSRWRLQELPTTELKLNRFSDSGPDFGRRYALFTIKRGSGSWKYRPTTSTPPKCQRCTQK
jgi:hypothetical protein